MKNYVQQGILVTIPAPYDVKSGDAVWQGAFFGFAATDAAKGEDVAVQTAGVFDTTKDNSTFEVGDAVFWHSSKKAFTKTSAANVSAKIGVAVRTAEALSTHVRVLLSRQATPVTSAAK